MAHQKYVIGLATALLALLTTAQADTAIYGSIRYSIDYSYNHGSAQKWQYDALNNLINKRKRGFNLVDQGSRLGLTGSESLGNGVKVMYHLEWGFNGIEGLNSGGGFNNRLAYIGLKSDFGTVTIGRIENPFKQMLQLQTTTALANANWNSGAMSAAGDLFYGTMGSLNNFNASMLFRVGNTVGYTSPTWGGFKFDATVIMDGQNNEAPSAHNRKTTIDLWTLNLHYQHDSGYYLRAGYITGNSVRGSKRAAAYGLSTGFVTKQWGINAYLTHGQTKGAATFGAGNIRSQSFWQQQNNASGNYKHTATGWDVTGFYAFGPNYYSRINLSLSQANSNKKYHNVSQALSNTYEKNRLSLWALGFEQKLSARTRLWVEYESAKVKQKFNEHNSVLNQRYRPKRFNNNRLLVGMRHDF